MVASTAVRLKMLMIEYLIAGFLKEDALLQRVYRIMRTMDYLEAVAGPGEGKSCIIRGKKGAAILLRYCITLPSEALETDTAAVLFDTSQSIMLITCSFPNWKCKGKL